MKDMLGTLVRRVVNLPTEMLGTICDLIEKLSSEAGQEWLIELKKFVCKENCWMKNTYLHLLTLIIDACDGVNVLADANDVFAYIDPVLKDLKADQRGSAFGKTFVEVYETQKAGTFTQLFGSLSPDLRKLCLTQNQIVCFIKKYRDWIQADGYSTFFLFILNNQFCVADVFYSDSGLVLRVYDFDGSRIRRGGLAFYLVVPKLA